jgi:hypothetical protein
MGQMFVEEAVRSRIVIASRPDVGKSRSNEQ